MKYFSTDSDLMRFETMLFSDWNLNGQIVSTGSGGSTSGFRLTAPSASFIAAGVEPGYVIYLTNPISTVNNRYEVISVDSATQLTISLARCDSGDPVRAPVAATDVTWRVCSYAPQANEAFRRMCARFGITAAQAATIPDTSTLREASIFLTMSLVFTAMATRDGFSSDLLAKADKYAMAYLEAIERCRFLVVVDGCIETRSGSEIALARD